MTDDKRHTLFSPLYPSPMDTLAKGGTVGTSTVIAATGTTASFMKAMTRTDRGPFYIEPIIEGGRGRGATDEFSFNQILTVSILKDLSMFDARVLIGLIDVCIYQLSKEYPIQHPEFKEPDLQMEIHIHTFQVDEGISGYMQLPNEKMWKIEEKGNELKLSSIKSPPKGSTKFSLKIQIQPHLEKVWKRLKEEQVHKK